MLKFSQKSRECHCNREGTGPLDSKKEEEKKTLAEQVSIIFSTWSVLRFLQVTILLKNQQQKKPIYVWLVFCFGQSGC